MIDLETAVQAARDALTRMEAAGQGSPQDIATARYLLASNPREGVHAVRAVRAGTFRRSPRTHRGHRPLNRGATS